jgi:two-component system, OmpR family, sensor histidine kinase QseC
MNEAAPGASASLPEPGRPPRLPPSLRRRLLLWVSLATLLTYVLAAALSYQQARHEVKELMDGQMTKSARLLLVQAKGDPRLLAGLAESMAALRGVKSRSNELSIEFQIGHGDGRVLARSKHAPAAPLTGELGYATIEHNGTPWRSLILETPDGAYRVQVSQSVRLRNKEALEIANKTAAPLVVLLPLLILLIYVSIRRGLKPLDDLAGDVAARSPENLSPLAPAAAPAETLPLVTALNRLFARVVTTLDNERRFTADAAHELRTPLAALKVQAQVAQATKDAHQRGHALSQVIAGADRATRLVEQLLRLARLDPLLSLPNAQPIDLGMLAAAAVDDAHDAACRRQQTIDIDSPEDAIVVRGDTDLLAVALRNLVDNALRYTPAGGMVHLRVAREDGTPLVEVADNGPGVPDGELPRLVERFYRGRDNAAEGSGLGLAIVGRIAELHGARLDLRNLAGGGLAASLRWNGSG